MEIWFYIIYFVLLYSIYRTGFLTTLKNFFKDKYILIFLEMLGKVVWGIGVSVTGAFISEMLSYQVFFSSGFWLGIILIVIGVFIEVKAAKAVEIMNE